MTSKELQSLQAGDWLLRRFGSGRAICYQVGVVDGEEVYLDLLDGHGRPKEGFTGLIYKRFEILEYELLERDPL